MIALEKARTYLEQFGLTQAAGVLDSRMQIASQKNLSYADFLVDLLGIEAGVRRERYLKTRINMAHFPYYRTLEEFDFSFQPSIDERQIRELATTAFITDATNIIFLGPPGIGKTHLSISLGIKAIEQGHAVYMIRAHDLLEDLRRAQDENRLDRRMKVYMSPKVLIIDEFGVWPYDRLAATALFSLISARYEHGSIILTSNKGFSEWGEVLGDSVIATAILDRLLHHSHVINIRGESYRLREKKRAGFYTPPPPSQEPIKRGDDSD